MAVIFNTKLPIVFQSENSECALACLAMIASYFGLKIDLNMLRALCPVSDRGVKLKEILSIASDLGLTYRVLRVEVEDLPALKHPAILHWDLSHYVVLAGANSFKAVIHDPNVGRAVLSNAEVSKHFTGVAIEFSEAKNFQKFSFNTSLRISQLFTKVVGYKRFLSAIFAFTIFSQLLVIAIPVYFQSVIDVVISSLKIDLLYSLTGIFILAIILSSLISYVKDSLILYFGHSFNDQITSNIFKHLLGLPLNFFESRNIGDLITRFDSLDEVRRIITEDFVKIFTELLSFVVVGTIICWYSSTLFLIAIFSVFIFFVFKLLTYEKYKINVEDIARKRGAEQNFFLETIKSIETIKAFNVDAMRYSTWKNLYVGLQNSNLSLGMKHINQAVFRDFVLNFDMVITVFACSFLILNNNLSYGVFFALLTYKRLFSFSALNLIDIYFKVRILNLHLQRLAEIVTASRESIPVLNDFIGKGKQEFRSLEVKSLSYRYKGANVNCLTNINFFVSAGERVVIIGESGSGKTTLLKCMLGLIDDFDGDILVDGISVKNLTRKNIAKQFSFVMQNGSLFSGSIYDNISLFDPEIDFDRAKEAARTSCIYDDIIKLPMGFYTQIGDLSSTLSGGQEQRILIARALYSRPEVLIMDEGTANLDAATEAKLLENLNNLDIAIIHSAHREQIVASANRIITL